MTEHWKPVVGYEGLYEVSDMGRVRSLDMVDSLHRKHKGRILKQIKFNGTGHVIVNLHKDSRQKACLVHRLVLGAFIGPCPPDMECCHWNDMAADNRLENLRWGTREDNMRDMVRNGKHAETRKTHCVNGHKFTDENTLRGSKGERRCRECVRQQSSHRYHAKKERTS